MDYRLRTPEQVEKISTNICTNPNVASNYGWDVEVPGTVIGEDGYVSHTNDGEAHSVTYGKPTGSTSDLLVLVEPGQTYTVSYDQTSFLVDYGVDVEIVFLDEEDDPVSDSTAGTFVNRGGTRTVDYFYLTSVAPVDAHTMFIRFTAVKNSSSSTLEVTFRIGSLTIVEGGPPPCAYDGGRYVNGCPYRTQWDGEPGLSTSSLYSVRRIPRLYFNTIDGSPSVGSNLELAVGYGEVVQVTGREELEAIHYGGFDQLVTERSTLPDGPVNIYTDPDTAGPGTAVDPSSPTGRARTISSAFSIPLTEWKPGDTVEASMWLFLDEAATDYITDGSVELETTPVAHYVNNPAGRSPLSLSFTYMGFLWSPYTMTSADIQALVPNTWTRISLEGEIVTTDTPSIRVIPPAVGVMRVTGIQLLRNNSYSGYVSGSQANCEWLGTANASKSRMLI